MRIHYFVRTLNDKSGGGSHYNSIMYIRALRKAGHTVVVHVLYPKNNSFPPDIDPVVHKGFGLGHLGEQAFIVGVLNQYEAEADVFFLYSVEFMWAGGKYRRKGGVVPVMVYMDSCIPSLFTTHRKAMTRAMWLYQFKRWPWDKTFGLRDARHVDRFLPCSPFIGETYIKFGFPKDRFTVLPNIVPNTASLGSKRSAHEITVLYVGRLTYIKGVDLVVRAMARLKQFNAKLVLVGDGESRLQIEALLSKYSLKAEMPGWIPENEVGQYYKNADIFVHPTRCLDAAPRAVVGALQWGLPVIVPDTGGAAWIAGDAGLVYKTRDPQGLTKALRQMLESPELRSRLAEKATQQTERFEERAVYPQLEHVLQSVVAATHTPPLGS